ncbi:MAG TPA: GWxTD domain-containing protein [Bacteroidota bacterium]
MYVRVWLLLAALVSCLPVAAAQNAAPGTEAARRDSLVREGERELARKHPSRARELFEAVLDLDKHSVPAQLGLGKAAIQQKEWGDGISVFEDLLERDTSSLAAHLGAGICRREKGTQTALFLRAAQWNKAEAHFRRVLERDSAFQDVLFQYALLLDYRGNYHAALDLGERQLALRPDLPQAALDVLWLFRHFITTDDGSTIVPDLLARGSAHSRFFAGETLRRMGRYAEAEEIFQSLLLAPSLIPREAVYLALARLAFAQDEPVRAERLYWQAVDGISSWLGAAILFEDIKYIVSDAELSTYALLASDRKKSGFFHTFWAIRNPLPASPTNPRLAEHYQRFFVAEKLYEYFGFRTDFTNPDRQHYLEFPASFALNHEFNDKGLIYIRHGSPDDTYRTSGMSDPNDDPNESWLYYEKAGAPQMIFHFIMHNAVGNGWRFSSIPSDPGMYSNLIMWDVRYQRLLSGDELGRRSFELEFMDQAKKAVTEALNIDLHTWKKETRHFVIPHAIDAFRGAQGKTLLHVAFAIPLHPFRERLGDSAGTVRAEIGLSLSKSDGKLVASRLDTVVLPLSAARDETFIQLYRPAVLPDSIRVAMHCRDLQENTIGIWKEDLRVPDFTRPELSLSDLQFLLPSSSPASIEIHGVKVIVSPFTAVPRDRPLFVYWQMYNLVKDDDGRTGYRAELLVTPGESAPNDESVVVYHNDKEDTERDLAEFSRLDLGRFSTGLYTLTLRLTDRKRVQTLEKSRLFEITKP